MRDCEGLTFRVLDIVRGTTVDGPGFRTAIYLAGCAHGCPGCHNPQSHDPGGGYSMTLREIMEVVCAENFDVTLSGGDPLFHPDGVRLLAAAIKARGYGLWIYTGYTWEDICAHERLFAACAYADVVVDGPFVKDLADRDLLFRGSSNQRLVDVGQTIRHGSITEWEQNCL